MSSFCGLQAQVYQKINALGSMRRLGAHFACAFGNAVEDEGAFPIFFTHMNPELSKCWAVQAAIDAYAA